MPSKLSLFLALVAGELGVNALAAQPIAARGSSPKYPYDPDTTEYCSYWIDNVGTATKCTDIPANWGISMGDFLRWNPSLAPDCENFKTQTSYCVETTDEPTSTTSGAGSTPTSGNGIATPSPIQPGMVDNCDSFYFVPQDVNCQSIATTNKISLQEFITWNPQVGATCSGLWANAYVCVSVIGHEPATTTTTTMKPTTTAGNGISTPSPTQPNIVDNCDKFYYVNNDESCDVVASKNGITVAQLQSWNKAIGSTCSGLWANAYACVSIVGHEPSTTTTTTKKPATTTTTGNGISTPSPTQPNIVDNCDKFYYVNNDESCDVVASKNGITVAQLQSWNKAIGSTCSGLWANAYACVSIVGHEPSKTTTTTKKPTTTTTGNGISTPTPTQSGMVGNCRKFHFVQPNQTCATIAKQYNISEANFISWNPAVGGSSCSGLWSSTYACVGL